MVDPLLVIIGSITAFCGTYNAIKIRDFIIKIRNLRIKGGRINNLKNQDEFTPIRYILEKLRAKAKETGSEFVSAETCVSGGITRGSTIAMSKMA